MQQQYKLYREEKVESSYYKIKSYVIYYLITYHFPFLFIIVICETLFYLLFDCLILSTISLGAFSGEPVSKGGFGSYSIPS